MLKNGIFCEMVILVIFKGFLLVKNSEILIQIVPDRSIYYYFLHLHQVRVFNLLMILPFIKDAKLKDTPDCANIIQNDVEHLKVWSDENNLVFNVTKTKTMIFSTKQMS